MDRCQCLGSGWTCPNLGCFVLRKYARSKGIKFVVGEANSIACGGSPNISDTMVCAGWEWSRRTYTLIFPRPLRCGA